MLRILVVCHEGKICLFVPLLVSCCLRWFLRRKSDQQGQGNERSIVPTSGFQSSHVSLSPHWAPAVHSSPLPHSQNIWSPRERFSVTTSGGIHFIISTILENECTLAPANTSTGTGPSGVQLMLTQSRHTSFLQWMFTQAWKRCRDNSLPVKSVKKSDDSFKSSIQKDSFERILIYSIMTQFPLNNCVCRWW